jgi:acyl-CoA thioesterase-1
MQSDGLHPNQDGQPVVLDNILPHLEPLLSESQSDPSTSTFADQ